LQKCNDTKMWATSVVENDGKKCQASQDLH